jgi:hypothetical protein
VDLGGRSGWALKVSPPLGFNPQAIQPIVTVLTALSQLPQIGRVL